MCRIGFIHEACQAGARDGRNFPIESCSEGIARIFSRQYEDEDARAAYLSGFLMEAGARLSPVNAVHFARA